jgi:GT2 family glycosyltransferase
MSAEPARLRVSIVTPTTDAARYIDEAIDSVSCSEAVDIEHIVVHDGNWAFAEALAARFPQITIMRGSAEGATSAVASAFAQASGDFLLELNSDDLLVAGCLERLDICARQSPVIRIWTGGVRFFSHSSDAREKKLREVIAREETVLTLANLLDDLPLLNARFVHRSVLAEIGNLDPRFSACSDREFLIRAAMAGIPEAGLGVMVQELREHNESLTINRRRGWVPPYLAEHIAIAEHWRAQEQLAPDLQQTFRNWSARERLRLAKWQWQAGKPRDALRTINNGQRADPLWLARAATSVAAWVRRRR